MSAARARAAAIGVAVFAWAASCMFTPDLGPYARAPCGPGDSCPTGYQCLSSEQICIARCEDPPLCGEIAVSPEALPLATETRPYRVELAAIGGTAPYSFHEAAPLPAGLGLDDAGVLSGAPADAGLYQVRVEVEDHSVPPVIITVQRGLPVRALLRMAGPATLANAAAGQPYTEWLSATGGDGGYRFHLTDAGGLPAGLALAENGKVSGTVSNSGALSFEVEVVDGDDPPQAAVRPVTLNVVVLPVALQFATQSLPDGRLGTPYSYQLQRFGGTGPSSWTLLAGSLPQNMGIDPDGGVISGVPASRGKFSFTIQLGDAFTTVNKTFTFDVL